MWKTANKTRHDTREKSRVNIMVSIIDTNYCSERETYWLPASLWIYLYFPNQYMFGTK